MTTDRNITIETAMPEDEYKALVRTMSNPNVYPIERAIELAEELAEGDPDWEYCVESVNSHCAEIACYDEDGNFVAFF